MIGQTISHYKITEKLGEGGMGVVYKAEDTWLKRSVALKFLSEQTLGDEEQKARFLREAQSAALLDHPNIAAVYDIGEADGRTFMAMALVDGPVLSDRIKERPLKIDEALDVAIQMCEGLQEAHENGVTHRDIKPANIMLTRKGRVKITDFGLAHLAGRSKLTKSGTTLGTPAYMCPEQALGEATDRRGDIWGVGVVLYEMIAGKPPFDYEHEQAIIYSIINEAQEPLTALRTGLPTELDRTVGKALAKKPEERYQHVADMRVDLRSLKKTLESGKPTILRTAPAGSVGARHAVPAAPEETTGTRAQHAVPLHSPAEASEHPLAKYRVIEDVDETGDSVVYRAEDTQKKRVVDVRVVTESAARAAARNRRLQQIGLGVLALTAVGFAALWLGSSRTSQEMPLRKFAIPVEAAIANAHITPNGQHIFLKDSAGKVLVHDLDQFEPRALEGVEDFGFPCVSPDSQFVAFRDGREMKKVSLQGGPVATLCEASYSTVLGCSWSPDGSTIVFSNPEGLFEVSSQGGVPKAVGIDQKDRRGADFSQLHFLPLEGQRKLLFATGSNVYGTGRGQRPAFHVLDLQTGQQQELGSGLSPVYSPTGHILYQSQLWVGDLWALPFSLAEMEPTGEPFPIERDTRRHSISNDGTLVYLHQVGGAQQLLWRDRAGNKLGRIGQPQSRIGYPALSPDGRRVAVAGNEGGNSDIWIHEVDRPLKTRLTRYEGTDILPTWSPKGDRLAYSSSRTGDRDLYIIPTDGSQEPTLILTAPEFRQYITDWSTDEKILLFFRRRVGSREYDLWYLERSDDGSSYDAVLFLQSRFNERTAKFSPDGRYVAYSADESGEYEVYIRRFPDAGGRRRVSVNGGSQPRWRVEGEELFYVEGDTLMAVPVSTSPELTVGTPKPLFSSPGLLLKDGNALAYDVTPDGRRFVVWEQIEAKQEVQQSIRVVQNWFAEFKDGQTEP